PEARALQGWRRPPAHGLARAHLSRVPAVKQGRSRTLAQAENEARRFSRGAVPQTDPLARFLLPPTGLRSLLSDGLAASAGQRLRARLPALEPPQPPQRDGGWVLALVVGRRVVGGRGDPLRARA